jgi:hypothetical protein
LLRSLELNVQTPLPPLIGGHGITIQSEGERSTIDAAALSAPVFELRSGEITLRNLAIRSSSSYAILVSSPDKVSLSALRIFDSDIGVGAMGEFQIAISESDFTDNRIGIELLGPGTSLVERSTFKGQTETGLWAVAPPATLLRTGSIDASDNRFEGARFGIVTGNLKARLDNNEINGFSGDGILALGGRLELTDNRIWNGRGVAIRAVGLLGGTIARNDVHDNGTIGILLQAAGGAIVEDNHVYRNGYGIATLLSEGPAVVSLRNNLVVAQTLDGLVAIGDSPLITMNRALQNRLAGIRVFNLVRPTSYETASPLLTGNVLEDNGFDEPAYSEYRVAGELR